MKSWWSSFWLSPIDARAVGLVRIALVGALLTELQARLIESQFMAIQPAGFRTSNLALALFPAIAADAATIQPYVQFAAPIAGFMALLGIFTRISLIAFTALSACLFASESSFGFHDHGPSLVVQALTVLCICPGTSALSVDRIFRSPQNFQVSGWGYKLILSLLALIFFAAGLSKVRNGGQHWMSGETLQFYLSGESHSTRTQLFIGPEHEGDGVPTWRDGVGLTSYLYGAQKTAVGTWLSERLVLCQLFALAALVLELFFPLILFGRLLGGWVRTVFLVSAALFHLGVYLSMGITAFMPWIALELALLPRWGKGVDGGAMGAMVRRDGATQPLPHLS